MSTAFSRSNSDLEILSQGKLSNWRRIMKLVVNKHILKNAKIESNKSLLVVLTVVTRDNFHHLN